MQKVIVLFGGRSAEHEVSVRSAASVLAALDVTRYVALPVGISKCGRWQAGLDPRSILAANETAVPEPHGDEYMGPIARILAQADVIFPVLHGPFGEDGSMQGLFEVVDKPYVGSGVTASALGMDKVFQKTLYRCAGLPVVDFVWCSRKVYTGEPDAFHLEVEQAVGFPCFVKPANMGSSVGINKANNRDELRQAIAVALRYDNKVMVERAVKGREIECSVLGNEDLSSSLPGEIVPSGEFYDYTAKYLQPSTLHVRAELLPEQTHRVRELAMRAHELLGCAGLSRVDFFLLEDGTVYVNELNTMPGFTSISMYPKMWEASGLPYTELITRLIELAFARHRDGCRISVDYRE
ncbi:MAG: D-alanine--D-alanine ligase [Selenomonadales bacterium]|nr:D-alanine--D-alanine ligase [Selenomonadales bacterium]